MRALDVRLLGAFTVSVDGAEVPATAWPQRRAADLVKLLALTPSHRVARDRVLDALWPHLTPQAAAAALHKAAHYARRTLGWPEALTLSGGVVALAPDARITTDVERFEAGDDAAYAGDLLPDDLYESWAEDDRDRLRALALQRLRAAGRWDDVLALDPADEEAHRGRIRAAAQAGDRAAVVRSYTHLRTELARLGTQPSPVTERLFRDVSRGPAAVAPLGEQLPVEGQGAQLAAALGLLETADAGAGAVLLLHGEAGAGKTRLAELVLATAQERRWHTARASAEEHPDVLGAAARALRDARPDLAVGLADDAPADLLARAAHERGCAVLLDDLAAAPDEAATSLVELARIAALHRLVVIAGLRPSEARAALLRTGAELVAHRLATRLELEPTVGGVRPRTRYATTEDGARIAYQVVGDGPVDVVLVPGFVSNVEAAWDMPVARRMFSRIASFARLVLWDKRGTGLSDPVADVPSLDERMRDLRAVLDAAGSPRAVLAGVSEGGPMSLLFAARHPERVAGLALYNTAPRFMADTGHPRGWRQDTSEQLIARLFEHWGTGALLSVFAPSRADDPASREVFGRFQRAGASPTMGRATAEAMRRMDVRDVLADVRAPTLVVARVDDRLIDASGGRLIAEGVPGAQLVELPGSDHFPFLGDMDPFVAELEAFVAAGPVLDQASAGSSPRATRARNP